MFDSKLGTLLILFQLILTTIQKYIYNIRMLQMRKLKYKEGKQVAQDHTAVRGGAVRRA